MRRAWNTTRRRLELRPDWTENYPLLVVRKSAPAVAENCSNAVGVSRVSLGLERQRGARDEDRSRRRLPAPPRTIVWTRAERERSPPPLASRRTRCRPSGEYLYRVLRAVHTVETPKRFVPPNPEHEPAKAAASGDDLRQTKRKDAVACLQSLLKEGPYRLLWRPMSNSGLIPSYYKS